MCELNTHTAITPASSPASPFDFPRNGRNGRRGGKKSTSKWYRSWHLWGSPSPCCVYCDSVIVRYKGRKCQRGKQSHSVCRLLISRPLQIHAACPWETGSLLAHMSKHINILKKTRNISIFSVVSNNTKLLYKTQRVRGHAHYYVTARVQAAFHQHYDYLYILISSGGGEIPEDIRNKCFVYMLMCSWGLNASASLTCLISFKSIAHVWQEFVMNLEPLAYIKIYFALTGLSAGN